MALERPNAAASCKGPIYRYVAQLLSSMEATSRICSENVKERTDSFEKLMPDMFEADSLADPFFIDASFSSLGLSGCKFVTEEATKLCALSRSIKQICMKLDKSPTSKQATSSRSLEEERQPCQQTCASVVPEKKDASIKDKLSPRPKAKATSPRMRPACAPANTAPASSAPLCVSTPVRAAAKGRARQRSATFQCPAPIADPKANKSPRPSPREAKAKADPTAASATAPTAFLSPRSNPGRQCRGGVKDLMRKFEAQPSSIPGPSSASDKSRPLAAKTVSSMAQAWNGSSTLKDTNPNASASRSGPQSAVQAQVKAPEAPVVTETAPAPAPAAAAAPTVEKSSEPEVEPEVATNTAAPVVAASQEAPEVHDKALKERNAPEEQISAHVAAICNQVTAQVTGLKDLKEERLARQVSRQASPRKQTSPRALTPLCPKNPDDNYEISDKGENSEDEDDSHRSHKHVPEWCKSYHEVLLKQSTWDPDTIFGSKVPPCDATLIFPPELYKSLGKERPNRRRGSSQDWAKDRLRSREIHEYKKKMGQVDKVPKKA